MHTLAGAFTKGIFVTYCQSLLSLENRTHANGVASVMQSLSNRKSEINYK